VTGWRRHAGRLSRPSPGRRVSPLLFPDQLDLPLFFRRTPFFFFFSQRERQRPWERNGTTPSPLNGYFIRGPPPNPPPLFQSPPLSHGKIPRIGEVPSRPEAPPSVLSVSLQLPLRPTRSTPSSPSLLPIPPLLASSFVSFLRGGHVTTDAPQPFEHSFLSSVPLPFRFFQASKNSAA